MSIDDDDDPVMEPMLLDTVCAVIRQYFSSFVPYIRNGESEQAFLLRVVNTFEALPEEAWNNLTDREREWVESTIDERNARKLLAPPSNEGIPKSFRHRQEEARAAFSAFPLPNHDGSNSVH